MEATVRLLREAEMLEQGSAVGTRHASATTTARRRLELWPDAKTRLAAAKRLVAGESLDAILVRYPDGPVAKKDDGSPATARRRRIYAEFAIKQEAVRAGLVPAIDRDNAGAIREAYASEGMAWVECRTGLSHGTIRKRLQASRPQR